MIDNDWVRTYGEKNIWSGSGNICTSGRMGAGTSGPIAKLHVWESTGTAAGADSGSIILDHDNAGGSSSITFRSKNNRGSDYGYIQYRDDANINGSGEGSRLIIGVENDSDNTSISDHVILLPAGNVGVGTNNPSEKLHVSGTIRSDRLNTYQAAVDFAGTNHIHMNTSSLRIGIALGGAENGSNSGSDLKVNTYSDSGGYLATPFVLTRSNGNLFIAGVLSKGGGSFDIKHPINEKAEKDDRLVHSFIEGPRCDLIYRGVKRLVNGRATVDLNKECVKDPECQMSPGTFEQLCGNPQYFLQNHTSFSRLRGTITGCMLSIECEDLNSTDEVYWTVIAERVDPFIKQWERTNENGYLITEYNKKM
jgi:hypothetical protein